MLKNSINKCKTKTKVTIESCASEYESCASDNESYASKYKSCASEYDSNNEPFDSVNNTKTWVSMLFDSDSDSYSDSEYDSCDYESKPYVNNTKTWVSMLFDSDSDSEFDSRDSDSDSDCDSEHDLCDSDSDSDYDSCDSDSDSDYDSEHDSCDKTDINDNKEIINQLNNFITLRKSFLNYINKIEVLRSEIKDDIYSDLLISKVC